MTIVTAGKGWFQVKNTQKCKNLNCKNGFKNIWYCKEIYTKTREHRYTGKAVVHFAEFFKRIWENWTDRVVWDTLEKTKPQCLVCRKKCICQDLCCCHTKRRIGGPSQIILLSQSHAPACQPSFWYDNKKDLENKNAFVRHMPQIVQ